MPLHTAGSFIAYTGHFPTYILTAMKIRSFGLMGKLCPYSPHVSAVFRIPIPKCLCLLLLVFLSLSGVVVAWGQPNGGGTPPPAGNGVIRPLQVGDTLPLTIVQVSLPRKEMVSIPQTGRLTILYFWHTGCTNCWFKFPLLDSLRRKYADRLNIITITRQRSEDIEPFIKRTDKIKNNQLPAVTSDSLLNQAFPHVMLSHVAWLDEGGKVLALTWGDYITEANIKHLLAGNTPNWRVKADLVKYDGDKPLLSFNKAAGYNLVPQQPSYFYWNGTIPGLDSRVYFGNTPQGSRITAINIGYRTLISMALGGVPPHTNRYQVPDTLMPYLFKPAGMYLDEWQERYNTCFEMFTPPGVSEREADRYLKEALESRLKLAMRYDTAQVRIWLISGQGVAPAHKRETIGKRESGWNNISPVPIVCSPAAAGAGFRTAPGPADLADFNSFSAWCSQNNLVAKDTTGPLKILTIQPK